MSRLVRFAPALLALTLSAAGASAAELKPFQKQALEQILSTMDPAMRDMARPQLEQSLQFMTEPQVQMMLDGFAGALAEQSAAESAPEEPEPAEATPEDLAHNRAQYEPVAKAAFKAEQEFGAFVRAAIERLGTGKEHAVFGHGWRYEMYPLLDGWEKIGDNFDLYLSTIDTMAPKDARYRYDLSGVRTSFDKAAVEAAMKKALAEHDALGQRFLTEMRALTKAEKWDEAFALEQSYNAKAAPIRENLRTYLQQQSPKIDALTMAVINGTPVKQ